MTHREILLVVEGARQAILGGMGLPRTPPGSASLYLLESVWLVESFYSTLIPNTAERFSWGLVLSYFIFFKRRSYSWCVTLLLTVRSLICQHGPCNLHIK